MRGQILNTLSWGIMAIAMVLLHYNEKTAIAAMILSILFMALSGAVILIDYNTAKKREE